MLTKKEQKFIDNLIYIDPRAIYIKRYKPNAMTKSGLFKPYEVQDKEVRSTMWGQVVLKSEESIDDPLTMKFKDSIKVGNWVMFLPQNTINGGLPGCPLLQMTAFTDVKAVLSDTLFNELIKGED